MPRWRFVDSTKLKLERLFDSIDVDGDGNLDAEEMKKFARDRFGDDVQAQKETGQTMDSWAERIMKNKSEITKADFITNSIDEIGDKKASMWAQQTLEQRDTSKSATDEVVLIKSGRLLGRSMDDTSGHSAHANTLVHAVQACTHLLSAAGVNGVDRNNWQLAADALVATMLILKRLSKATELDRDGTHSSSCTTESRHKNSEKDAREAIVKKLVESEWDGEKTRDHL